MSDNRKVSVGGQALIEGILMRGPKGSAMALRMPDGSISVEKKDHVSITKKYKFLGVPVIRGIASFIDSLVFGYKCMMESAEKTTLDDIKSDDGEDMSKFDRWITDHFGEKMMTALTIIASILGVLLAVFLFMWFPYKIFTWINNAVKEAHPNFEYFRGLLEGIMRMIIFVGYMLLVSRMPDIKRVFMYHGAEHKSIFCFENDLELTVENVRNQSRFHPRCGTSFMFVMIIFSVIVSSIFSIAIPALTKHALVWVLIKIVVILPIVMGVGFEFIKYAGTHDNRCVKILSAPGLWMQRITTVEPTDDIIEVGIASLKAALYGIDEENENDESDEEYDDFEEEQSASVYEKYESITPDDFDEEEAVEETQDDIEQLEEAIEEKEEITQENEEISSDLINKSVDEMMEELYKETSFNETE